MLLAALTGSGTSFGWVVTLVAHRHRHACSRRRSERCDVCTVSEALSAATLATVNLLSTIPETLPDERADSRAPLAVASRSKQKVAALEHAPRRAPGSR